MENIFDEIDENANNYPTFETNDDDDDIGANSSALAAAGIQQIPLSAFTEGWYPMYHYHDVINYAMYLMAERNSIPGHGQHKIVFVWDIGEITMLASNYIMWYKMSNSGIKYSLLDTMIGRIIKKTNVYAEDSFINIEDAVDDGTYEMKKLVTKYEALERFYNEITDGIREDGPIIDYGLVEKCGMVEKIVDLYNAAADIYKSRACRWKLVKPCLESINKKSNESTNVVICKEKIEHGAAQLLISGMSKHIPIENIYSTCDLVWKETVFERIQRKFGEKCVLVYMTSQCPQDVVIPPMLQIPIFQIHADDSFEHLNTILHDAWLN